MSSATFRSSAIRPMSQSSGARTGLALQAEQALRRCAGYSSRFALRPPVRRSTVNRPPAHSSISRNIYHAPTAGAWYLVKKQRNVPEVCVPKINARPWRPDLGARSRATSRASSTKFRDKFRDQFRTSGQISTLRSKFTDNKKVTKMFFIFVFRRSL